MPELAYQRTDSRLLLPLKSSRFRGCNNYPGPTITANFIHPGPNGEGPGLVYCLFSLCTRTQLHTCEQQECLKLKKSLYAVMPQCRSWKGLSEWVLQLAACNCTGKRPNRPGLEKLVPIIANTIINCHAVHPTGILNPPMDEACLEWERSVQIPEVLALCSWLNALFNDRYEYLYPHGDRTCIERELGQSVVDATKRARDLGLCPQRIWAISTNLPGSELNLPTLVPRLKTTIWGRDGHEDCSFDHCEESIKSFTSVTARHFCADPTTCNTKSFSQGLLLKAIKAGISTAWSLDGRSICNNRPYMAVSHVWADGTGTGGRSHGIANSCLYDFFCARARDFGCEGIWWDTICLPADKTARCSAINNMHLNYEKASVTLVHDSFLSEFDWVDAESACFAIIMSSWFSRGWTALEMARSKTVKILFNHGVIKDLDQDIIRQVRTPSSPHYQVTTTAILDLILWQPTSLAKSFVPKSRGVPNRRKLNNICSVNGLLTSLGPRYTSWSRDKAIIAGLFVGIKDPSRTAQQEIYRQILRKIGKISPAHLFHGTTTMSTPGFRWCPTDIFKMPVGSRSGAGESVSLIVKENGDLFGPWELCCLKQIANGDFTWDTTHPLIRPALQLAVEAIHNHVLLISPQPSLSTKGLIVKVMWKPTEHWVTNTPEICGRLVGFVSIRDTWKKPRLPIMNVRIGELDEMVQMPKDQSFCRYSHDLRGEQQPMAIVRGVGDESLLHPCQFV